MTRNAILSRTAFVLAYAGLAIISMRQRDALTLSTVYWPPAGLLLGVLVRTPTARWPGWIVLAAVMHVATSMTIAHRSWQIAAVFALADPLLCSAVAAAWRRQAGPRPTLTRLPDLLGFLALLTAGSLAGGGLVVLGLLWVAPTTPTEHWYVWSMAGFVGCVVATPLVLGATEFRLRHLERQSLLNLWLGLLAAFALLAGTTLAFDSSLTAGLWPDSAPWDLSYGPLIFLALVAVTWGYAGASITVVGLAMIARSYTTSGLGPYGGVLDAGHALLGVQGYLGAAAVLSLLTCALNAERQGAARGAGLWRARMQAALLVSGQLAWEYDAGARRITWMGGTPPWPSQPAADVALEDWLHHVHPADRDTVRAWFDAARAPATARQLRFRMQWHDSAYQVAEMSLFPAEDAGTARHAAGILAPAGNDRFGMPAYASPAPAEERT